MQSTKDNVNYQLSELTADILKALAAKLSPEQTSRTSNSQQEQRRYQNNGARQQNFQKQQQPQQQQQIENKNKPRPRTPRNVGAKTSPVQFQGQQKTGPAKPKAALNKPNPKEIGLDKIRKNEKVIILLRGCPGSGKTTLARQLQHNGVIFSADDYFVKNGKYEFDPTKLNEAHAHVKNWCQRAIENKRTPIIIDNTNLEAWEMIPYVNMALKNQYFVLLLEPETPWRYNPAQLKARNTHNIGYNKIVRMLEVFDRHLTAAHLIKSCKLSPNPDPKPFRSTPPPLMNIQKSWNFVGQAQSKVGRPKIPLAGDSSSIASSRQPGPSPSLDEWSSNEDESISSHEPKLSKKSQSVPDMLNQLGTLRVHQPSPFVPVLASSPKHKKPNQSHIDDLLDLDFSCIHQTSDSPPLEKNNVQSLEAFVANLRYEEGTTKKNEIKNSLNVETNEKPKLFETEDNEDPIRVLKSFFSTVPDEDLADIYARCNGDLQWVVNLLLDGGYEMMKPEDEVSPPEISKENVMDSDLIDLIADQQPTQPKTFRVPIISVSDEDQAQPSSTETFHFRLDAGFAQLLQDTFGPVGYNLSSDSYSGSELDVMIPFEVAASIHKCWSANLRDKFKQEDLELVQMLTDEAYAEMLHDEELAMKSGFYPGGKLEEFPALGAQNPGRQNSQQNSESWSVMNNQDLALKIKRKQLYEQFPQIDPKAIDEMLESNDSRYSETFNTLRLLYEPDNLPQHVIAPEFSQEYEKYILQSLAEQELDMGATVEDKLEEPTFAQLREQAQYMLGLRKEFSDKAKTAFQNGLKDVASFYSQKGHQYTYIIQSANQRAAEMILEITNSGRHPNTLDLHLLTTREALKTLTEFLSRKQNEINTASNGRKSMVVYIITGRGSHSAEGIAKIRSAVDTYLKTKKYSCYQVNAGCIEVILRSTVS